MTDFIARWDGRPDWYDQPPANFTDVALQVFAEHRVERLDVAREWFDAHPGDTILLAAYYLAAGLDTVADAAPWIDQGLDGPTAYLFISSGVASPKDAQGWLDSPVPAADVRGYLSVDVDVDVASECVRRNLTADDMHHARRLTLTDLDEIVTWSRHATFAAAAKTYVELHSAGGAQFRAALAVLAAGRRLGRPPARTFALLLDGEVTHSALAASDDQLAVAVTLTEDNPETTASEFRENLTMLS